MSSVMSSAEGKQEQLDAIPTIAVQFTKSPNAYVDGLPEDGDSTLPPQARWWYYQLGTKVSFLYKHQVSSDSVSIVTFRQEENIGTTL